MNDGIIQQVFKKHNMIYLTDEHILNELQQELIEKIKQAIKNTPLENDDFIDRLIGDKKE